MLTWESTIDSMSSHGFMAMHGAPSSTTDAGTYHVIRVQRPDVCGHLLSPSVHNAARLDARIDLIVAGGCRLIGKLEGKDGGILRPFDACDAVGARQQRLDIPFVGLSRSQHRLPMRTSLLKVACLALEMGQSFVTVYELQVHACIRLSHDMLYRPACYAALTWRVMLLV